MMAVVVRMVVGDIYGAGDGMVVIMLGVRMIMVLFLLLLLIVCRR